MDLNEQIQWLGAVFIVLGHLFNAIGPRMYPYNIWVFTCGTLCFLTWSIRVDNSPQLAVNVVALVICLSGLIKAYKERLK